MGKAIILQGLDFSKISIGKVHITNGSPLRSLMGINGPSKVFGAANAATFYPSYSPLNTSQRDVTWSIVSGSGYATITNGVLSIIEGAYNNVVIIRASSTVDSTITIDKSVTVTYSEWQGYITSGLVAHWDAIDKNNDNNPSKWGDLVGGIIAGANVSIFGNNNDRNYAGFNGTYRMYFISQEAIPITTTKYTIEICYDKSNATKKECLFVYSTQEKGALAAFATWGDNGEYIITGGNSSNQKCFENIGTYPRTTSVVNQTKCIINGVPQEVSGSQNYFGGSNKYIAGGYNTFFNGKIYSIRIYNRELSDEEIINNQKYDKFRFGL